MPPLNRNACSPCQKALSSKFRVENDKRAVHKRDRFGPERLQEVNEVRRDRACLRCSLLKRPCSKGLICTRCRELALHVHEKQMLSFSGCIRTRLVEVSIFEAHLPPTALRGSVLRKGNALDLTAISLQFESEVTWELDALVSDFVAWLNDTVDSARSQVGTLTSPRFSDLVRSSTDDPKIAHFQRMIYAESLAYTQPTAPIKHYLSISELRQIGALAGHEFLRYLDDNLRPQSLKNCSGDEIRALFLLVAGTILAVGYTLPFAEELEIAADTHEFLAVQYHLCQILAHYMVYLASHLKLPIASRDEQFLLETAPARWHKEGIFRWWNGEDYNFDIDENLDCEDYQSEEEDDSEAFTVNQREESEHVLNPMQPDREAQLMASIDPLESFSVLKDGCGTYWNESECLNSSPFPPALSDPYFGFEMGPTQNENRTCHFDSQNENFQSLTVPHLDYWSGPLQSSLDTSPEMVGTCAENKAESYLLNRDQQLPFGHFQLINQNDLSFCPNVSQQKRDGYAFQNFQTPQPARRSWRFTPYRRMEVAMIRRMGTCVRCHSMRGFWKPGLDSPLCSRCHALSYRLSFLGYTSDKYARWYCSYKPTGEATKKVWDDLQRHNRTQNPSRLTLHSHSHAEYLCNFTRSDNFGAHQKKSGHFPAYGARRLGCSADEHLAVAEGSAIQIAETCSLHLYLLV